MEDHNTYEMSETGLQIKGNEYPVQLCTLYLFRLQRLQQNSSIRSYKIGAEVKNSGKFDDITINIDEANGTNHYFMQLKHKDNENKLLTIENLLSDEKFKLDKYFSSFLEIRKCDYYKNGNIKSMIIFTPMNVDTELKKFLQPIEFDDILNLKKDGSMFYKLADIEKTKEWITKALNFVDKKKKIRKLEITDTDITDFCDKFILAVCQPRYEEMKLLLQNEIDNFSKTINYNDNFSKTINYNDWCEEVKKWIIQRSKMKSYLTSEKFKDFRRNLTKPNNEKLYEMIRGVNSFKENSHKQEIVDHLKKDGFVEKEYFISRDKKRMFLKELMTILHELKKEYVYVDQKYFSPDDEVFCSSFNRVLIVDCDTCLTYNNYNFFVHNCEKVVVILDDEFDIYINRDIGKTIFNLPENYIQEDFVQYYYNEEEYNKSKSQIKLLISDQKIEIDNVSEDINVIDKYEGDINHLFRNHQYRQFAMLNNHESERFVLLISSPGSGKTVFSKMLELNYRKNEKFQEYCVIYSTCKEFKSKVGIHQNDSTDEIISKINQKWNLTDTSKVIVILDAFDEAIDDDKNIILKFLDKSRHWCILKKCFLTSREKNQEKLLEQIFGIRYWQLLKISEKNQKDFLVQYFQKRAPNISSNIDEFVKYTLEDVKFSSLDVLIKEPLHLKLMADFTVKNISNDESKNSKFLGAGWYLELAVNTKIDVCLQEKLGAMEKNAYSEKYKEYFRKRIIEDLENLAWKIIIEQKSTLQEVNDYSMHTGLLYQLGDNTIDFIHRTFAEYFAAQAIINKPDKIDIVKLNFLFDPEQISSSSHMSLVYEFLSFKILKLGEQKTYLLAQCIRDKIVMKKKMNISKMLGNCYAKNHLLTFLCKNLGHNEKKKLFFEYDHSKIESLCFRNHAEFLDILMKSIDKKSLKNEICVKLRYFDEQYKHPEILKVLLQHSKSEDIQCENSFVNHLLDQAFSYGYEKRILVIIYHMKSILNEEKYKIWAEKVELSPYILPTIQKNFNEMKRLYDQGYNIHLYSEVFGTILHFTVKCKNIEATKFILEIKNFALDKYNKNRLTAMHVACLEGSSKILKLLIEKRADYKLHDYVGRTPLHYAWFGYHMDCIKMLLETDKSQIEVIKDKFSRATLLFEAAGFSAEFVKYLLDNGANINHRCVNGQTPLMKSITSKKFDCFNYIITSLGCKVDEVDIYGYSALMLAIEWTNFEVIELLLINGANPNLANKDGKNFYDLLIEMSQKFDNKSNAIICRSLLLLKFIKIPSKYVSVLNNIVEKGNQLSD